MEEIIPKAREMGAADPDITSWLDTLDPAFGCTPRQLVDSGRSIEVMDTLFRMDEGVFG